MNIVYTTCTNDKFLPLLFIMLESLFKHNDCIVYLGLVDATERIRKKIALISPNIIIYPVDNWKNQRMSSKIINIGELPISLGDKVFILDADLYIRCNLFDLFDKDTDVIITERPDFFLTVNGGVWGFKYNSKGKQFLDFYIDQVKAPTWSEFIEFAKIQYEREGRRRRTEAWGDWWIDQDFLCVMNDRGLPFDCNIKKLDYKIYNISPPKKSIMNCVQNSDKKIIHFKGALKSYWLNYYDKYIKK